MSAIVAPRCPIGRGLPVVVSCRVWCSISEFSSAPASTMIAVIQSQVIRPKMAPSEP